MPALRELNLVSMWVLNLVVFLNCVDAEYVRQAFRVPPPNVSSTWHCVLLNETQIAGIDVLWKRHNCSGSTPFGNNGPMIFNSLEVNLASEKIYVTPMIANNEYQLAPLNTIAAQDARIVAGINGGYFYRTDVSTFVDNVSWGKSKTEALQPVNQKEPNDGVGDGLVVINGSQFSSNCDCLGYNRPATLVVNKTSSYIVVQSTASPSPPGAMFSLAAGPNLVSHNASGSFFGIPADDENSNVLEWSANTAVGLTQDETTGGLTMTMVTADGYDGCPFYTDTTCGINALILSYFMKDALGVTSAMGMDQGGSTTMFVKGYGRDGIVSCSSDKECSGGGRPIFSGLMVGVY